MLSRPDNRDREQIQEWTPEPLAQIDRCDDRAQFGADMQPTEERVDPGKVRQFLLAEFDRNAAGEIADRVSARCLYFRLMIHVLPRRYAPSKIEGRWPIQILHPARALTVTRARYNWTA